MLRLKAFTHVSRRYESFVGTLTDKRCSTMKQTALKILGAIAVMALSARVLHADSKPKDKEDKVKPKDERVVSVPEPSALTLLMLGIGGVVAGAERRRRARK
jgi:hypothetical protein